MITLMMGAPASGKTTYIQQNRLLNDLVTSSDLVRLDREVEMADAMLTFRAKGVNWAKQGKSFWVDATNTFADHRLFWIKISNIYQMPIRIIAMNTPYNICQNRNKQRENPADMKVVRAHSRRMQSALSLIHNEGYQSIEVINGFRYAVNNE